MASGPPRWPRSLLGPLWKAAIAQASSISPEDEAAAPWFYINETESAAHGVVILGRFADKLYGSGIETRGTPTDAPDTSYGRAAVAWHDHGTFRTLYSCSSTSAAFSSLEGWRAVMAAAGAHIYLPDDDFLGDSVEARVGLGRIVAVCYRSFTLHQIR